MAEKRLVSFSLVFLAVVVLAGQAQGTDLCAKSDYVALCRAVVNGVSDPKVALKSAIEHLIFLTERAKESSTKLGKVGPIDVCRTNFDDAISSLKESLQHMKNNDKPSLNVKLSAASTFYVTCDDAVAEGGIVKLASGLLNTDTTLRHMAGNCLYLSTLF